MRAGSPDKETLVENLILFVVGDSPRSQRARSNLRRMLDQLDIGQSGLREVNLLETPGQAVKHGIFATPALKDTRNADNPAVIYGDLSDQAVLERFLVD